jgi:hypothetical protein
MRISRDIKQGLITLGDEEDEPDGSHGKPWWANRQGEPDDYAMPRKGLSELRSDSERRAILGVLEEARDALLTSSRDAATKAAMIDQLVEAIAKAADLLETVADERDGWRVAALAGQRALETIADR